MTRYAYDADRATVVSAWETPSGAIARDAFDVAAIEEPHALRLANTLTALSEAVWTAYTQPADAGDSNAERAAFDDVTAAIANPNLPDRGALLESYSAVTETAHRVGRALHAVGDKAPTEHVLAEARAELGDFSARAAQALLLSRADPSPVQVAAADEMLVDDPLDHARLFTFVDPAAAAVAATRWLEAAADVVADLARIDVETVMREAEWIEAMPVRTTVEVLSRLELDWSPHDIVVDLISEAMAVAHGETLDPSGLIDRLTDAEAETDDRHDRPSDSPTRPRVAVLDPARPALDLLEDLLAGIKGCWLVYSGFADDVGEDAPVESPDDNFEDDLSERMASAFIAAVRERAAANRPTFP